MRLPDPIANTTTEAYLAYKAGVLAEGDLKPKLYEPYIHLDAWLAYWAGLVATYPVDKNNDPEMLTDEEAFIAYLSGVTNTYPQEFRDPADIRVAAYLRYLISARWGRPEYPVNNEEFYLSLMKTKFIPSGDPSSDITIDGTAKAPFVDVKMYGDTFQQTYTGKNLFNPFAQHSAGWTASSAGIDYTLQSDGSVYCEGQATAVSHVNIFGEWNNNSPVYIQLDTSKTYTAKLYGATDGWIGVLKDGAREYKRLNSLNNPTTITGYEGITLARIDFANGQSSDLMANIQIEVGSDATSFEPYVGGVPSPNPDYPQIIQTVTGEQMVEVQGKNLFNGIFRQGNQLNTIASKRVFSQGDGIYLKTGDTITLSTDLDTTTKDYAIYLASIPYPVDDSQYIIYNSGYKQTSSFTYTATADGYLGFTVRKRDETSIAPSDLDGVHFQVELGSTPTAYAPYHATSYPLDLGTIELCKLGTYQDYIYKDGDDWKVHKATNKITVNGSENWQYPDSGANYTFFQFSRSNFRSKYGNAAVFYASNTEVGFAKADKFKQIIASAANMRTEQGIGFSVDGDDWLRISVANTIATTIDAFKTWLSSHPTTIYYALAAAVDTVITDQTLIAQLEALKNGGAENCTTYIKVNATDPNLPGLLYVEAPKYE